MIDWDRIGELRSEFGKDGFAEVVGLFLEEADEVVAQLASDLPAARVGDRLHFLKGSALNLGLRKLAALCQEGERLAEQTGGRGVDLAPVVECYHQSKAAFLALALQDAA